MRRVWSLLGQHKLGTFNDNPLDITSLLLLRSSSSLSSSYSNSPTMLSRAFLSRSRFFFKQEKGEKGVNVLRRPLSQNRAKCSIARLYPVPCLER